MILSHKKEETKMQKQFPNIFPRAKNWGVFSCQVISWLLGSSVPFSAPFPASSTPPSRIPQPSITPFKYIFPGLYLKVLTVSKSQGIVELD